jgi:pSer/pThr/pTyr-binding forkhead associated (FHA) protein
MKLSLVVLTSGKSQGQAIPVNLAQFLIGRDPQCNLRPASALISKRHCAVLTRGERVFLRDFGSTNGTFLNDKPVKDEIELKNEDVIKVGPLSFCVRLEVTPPVDRPTPPPPTKKPVHAPEEDTAGELLLSMLDDGPIISGSSSQVPEGSTVMDIIAMPGSGTPDPEAEKKKKEEEKKKAAASGNTSVAAKAILDKYMRRPRS